jgi:hypothetical protein
MCSEVFGPIFIAHYDYIKLWLQMCWMHLLFVLVLFQIELWIRMCDKVTNAQISPPPKIQNNANLPCYSSVESLACLGGMILVWLTFSLIIIHNSFRTIRNHGSIHIIVEVFRNILYSYLQKSDPKMTLFTILSSFGHTIWNTTKNKEQMHPTNV